MAVYIAIRMLSEDDVTVDYTFGSSDDKVGRIRLDKASGGTVLIDPAPNDEGSRLFLRAAYKLKKHWEKGEFPDKTCWAS